MLSTETTGHGPARATPKRVTGPTPAPLQHQAKRGLRRIQTCLQNLCGLPDLWSVWQI